MLFSLIYTNRFKKDVKLCQKRNYDIKLLENILLELSTKGQIPSKHKPHILSGNKDGVWECHIKADWLLTWYHDEEIIIVLRTGTHSDLF